MIEPETQLTQEEVDQRVFEILQAAGGWVTPRDVRLSREADVYVALRHLVAQGRVERRGQASGGVKTRYEYRARNV